MENAKLVTFPKIFDDRGNLSFIESENHVPFSIKRSYLIYDVPGGEIRGGHAFIEQEETIIALSGSLDIIIFDGKKESTNFINKYYCNDCHNGIYPWWKKIFIDPIIKFISR